MLHHPRKPGVYTGTYGLWYSALTFACMIYKAYTYATFVEALKADGRDHLREHGWVAQSEQGLIVSTPLEMGIPQDADHLAARKRS